MRAQEQSKSNDFEDVARLIAAGEIDVGWLTYGLRFWVWPQEKWSAYMRAKYGPGQGMFASFAGMRRGRAEVVKKLAKTLPGAVDELIALTDDWTLRQFIFDDAFNSGFGPHEHISLSQLLHELRRRSTKAARAPELVDEKGKPKAGRNKALAPGQVDEKVACAATVMTAWKFARGGQPPGPQVRAAAEAAAILFALGSAPAGQYGEVEPLKRYGGDVVKTWRPHFEAAALPNSALERLNTMFAGELEFIRKWYAGDPAARAFPSMLAVNPPRNEPI